MRWKEKFLVPDHRVQDISGASFAGKLHPYRAGGFALRSSDMHAETLRAGFYYVCVDFNPQPSASHAVHDSPLTPTLEDLPESPPSSPPKPELAPRARRESVTRGARKLVRSPSSTRAVPSNVATMSGFYFHQHSEP